MVEIRERVVYSVVWCLTHGVYESVEEAKAYRSLTAAEWVEVERRVAALLDLSVIANPERAR